MLPLYSNVPGPNQSTRSCLVTLKKTLSIVPFLLWAIIFPSNPATAETDEKSLIVQAALLYKLTKFIIWPEEAFPQKDSPLNICVAGPYGKRLSELLKQGTLEKTSQKRRLETFYLPDIEKGLTRHSCHLLFFGAVPKEELRTLYKRVDTANLLVISDSKDLLESGAMMSILLEKNKMVLHINIDSILSSSNVKIKDALFSVGKIVRSGDKKSD